MKKSLFLLLLWLAAGHLWAQTPGLVAGELTDSHPHDSEAVWARVPAAPQMGWGSIDVRYAKYNVPRDARATTVRLSAWGGERVAAQAVVWTRRQIDAPRVAVSDLVSGAHRIPAAAVSANFEGYVMTDELNHNGKSNCGARPNKADYDSSIVADMLYGSAIDLIPARSARPIWVSVQVPVGAKSGVYRGILTMTAKGIKPVRLRIEVSVGRRSLPAPDKWAFNLDLWQNPYAVARVMNVPLWSRAHFDAMRPVMKMLARAGQKSITASIMLRPWNGQTEDAFCSMIQRTLTVDGRWEYDYTVFDRWVNFMLHDVGIDGVINCYTMIPWALQFDYYDQASNTVRFVHAKPQEAAYRDYWLPFLRDFSRHLRQQGWFRRTAISMDERSLEDMTAAIRVIRDADPEFHITLAGAYHPEIEAELSYLSVPYAHPLDSTVIQRRRQRGQATTYYVCCTESFPNTFTFSEPAEAAFIPIHALAQDYDGVLRWAYNSWTAHPMRDTRFRSWPAGDTYLVYPGGRSSVRFERLVEGIQCCEKIRLLRRHLQQSADRRGLARLDSALRVFGWGGLEQSQLSTGQRVSRLQQVLNSL